jgi:hypothetical protein
MGDHARRDDNLATIFVSADMAIYIAVVSMCQPILFFQKATLVLREAISYKELVTLILYIFCINLIIEILT